MEPRLVIGYLILLVVMGVVVMRQIHKHGKKHKRGFCVGMTAVIRPKKRRFVMDLRMDWTDAAVLGIAPTDDSGHPAPVQTVTWESDNPSVTIEPSTDGKKAYAVPADGFLTQPDPAQPDVPVVVTAHVDVDLGEGVENVDAVFNLTVSNPKATQLNPSGTTIEKEGRPPLG